MNITDNQDTCHHMISFLPLQDLVTLRTINKKLSQIATVALKKQVRQYKTENYRIKNAIAMIDFVEYLNRPKVITLLSMIFDMLRGP